MALDLSRVVAAVAAEKAADDSAVLLMGQLSDLVRATAGDPAAVNALADEMQAQATAMAAAVATFTPGGATV